MCLCDPTPYAETDWNKFLCLNLFLIKLDNFSLVYMVISHGHELRTH